MVGSNPTNCVGRQPHFVADKKETYKSWVLSVVRTKACVWVRNSLYEQSRLAVQRAYIPWLFFCAVTMVRLRSVLDERHLLRRRVFIRFSQTTALIQLFQVGNGYRVMPVCLFGQQNCMVGSNPINCMRVKPPFPPKWALCPLCTSTRCTPLAAVPDSGVLGSNPLTAFA